MTESTPEGAEARLEPFTPAERAVMAGRAEAQQMRAERDTARAWARRWKRAAKMAAYRNRQWRGKWEQTIDTYSRHLHQAQDDRNALQIACANNEEAYELCRARAESLEAERDAAVWSVAALFHAYIAITPGETVEGLEPKVAAQADELLGYLIELEARHSDVLALTAPLADENASLRAQLDETRARLADLARQATAAGPVLEAAEAWAACGGDALEDYALRRELRRAVAALRAAREGGSK